MKNKLSPWMNISDLMSVLMMVFLFLSILFMVQVEQRNKEIKRQNQVMHRVLDAFELSSDELQVKMQQQFSADVDQWQAEVLEDGSVRFNDKKSLFQVGSSEMSRGFKQILTEFFPRYITMLYNSDLRDEIDAIEIVGHTSSDWTGKGNSFIHNAELSQERAFAVLQYVYLLPAVEPYREWLQKVLRANGASHSELIYKNGVEDKQLSKRVEFHARIEANNKMNQLIRQIQ